MSQVILELDNRDDLELLLTLVRRLNISVVAVSQSPPKSPKKEGKEDARLVKMRQAASDPLFLADVDAVNADFEHVDLGIEK